MCRRHSDCQCSTGEQRCQRGRCVAARKTNKSARQKKRQQQSISSGKSIQTTMNQVNSTEEWWLKIVDNWLLEEKLYNTGGTTPVFSGENQSDKQRGKETSHQKMVGRRAISRKKRVCAIHIYAVDKAVAALPAQSQVWR